MSSNSPSLFCDQQRGSGWGREHQLTLLLRLLTLNNWWNPPCRVADPWGSVLPCPHWSSGLVGAALCWVQCSTDCCAGCCPWWVPWQCEHTPLTPSCFITPQLDPRDPFSSFTGVQTGFGGCRGSRPLQHTFLPRGARPSNRPTLGADRASGAAPGAAGLRTSDATATFQQLPRGSSPVTHGRHRQPLLSAGQPRVHAHRVTDPPHGAADAGHEWAERAAQNYTFHSLRAPLREERPLRPLRPLGACRQVALPGSSTARGLLERCTAPQRSGSRNLRALRIRAALCEKAENTAVIKAVAEV